MSRIENRSTGVRRPHFAQLDVHASLCRQLAELLDGEILRSRRTHWHSVTFAGARHQIVLRTAASLDRLAGLADHEFTLPGAFVADLDLVEIDDGLVTIEALVVDE